MITILFFLRGIYLERNKTYFDTKDFQNIELRCSDIYEILEFIKNNNSDFIDWKKYICNIVQIMGFSYEGLAKKCGFSKNTVRNWCTKGYLPQNRNAFIKLGFGLCMDVDEINSMLTKYGHYSELYPKDIHDAICIYVISKHIKEPDNVDYQYDSLKKMV